MSKRAKRRLTVAAGDNWDGQANVDPIANLHRLLDESTSRQVSPLVFPDVEAAQRYADAIGQPFIRNGR